MAREPAIQGSIASSTILLGALLIQSATNRSLLLPSPILQLQRHPYTALHRSRPSLHQLAPNHPTPATATARVPASIDNDHGDVALLLPLRYTAHLLFPSLEAARPGPSTHRWSCTTAASEVAPPSLLHSRRPGPPSPSSPLPPSSPGREVGGNSSFKLEYASARHWMFRYSYIGKILTKIMEA
ncbi:hypothetical protein EJB05_28442, partial [Eragrostis curvula]